MNWFRRSQQSRNFWIYWQPRAVGDLLDSVTDFERRVSSWEQRCARKYVRFDQHRGLKGLEEVGFRDHLLINTAGTTEWTKFVKEIENVEFSEKEHAACSDGLAGDGSQDQKFQGNCSRCGSYSHMARDCRKKAEYMQNNQTSGWSGTDDKAKGKSGMGKSEGKGKGEDKSKG